MMNNKPNEWRTKYFYYGVRPLDKSTKTIVKTYDEAKSLYDKTSKNHKATLVYAINEGSVDMQI